MDMRDLPFSILDQRHCFADLLPVLFLSLMSIAFPSSRPFALIGLGWPFLNALSWHHFLQPFSLFVNRCDIESGLFVWRLPLFWICVKNFKM